MIKNCVFRRLASAVWTNSPDNFNKNASFVYNFGNMNFEDCLFEEGYQWQQGIRGVDKGSMRNCVTVDIGRGFRAWNGVAGSMFFRCKDWVFEDSEWGFVSIGLGSGDGEAFDFEGNCNDMTMRNCLFHDTDGPGFLLCCYASDGHPNMGIVMENCVLNGKSKRPIGLPRCEIINTTDWTEATWKKCRFYISPGEVLMKVMDPEKEKRTKFVDCVVKKLGDACSTENLALKAKASASSQAPGGGAAGAIDGKTATFWRAASAKDQWLQLDFARPTTINEFKIKEGPGSSIIRYAIECWDDKASRWISCFNGRAIGRDFMAPVVSRTTRKARLFVTRTVKGNPCIAEFEAYDDTTTGPRTVNDSHADIVYSGGWVKYASWSEINGDEHYSKERGASCRFTFSGTGIALVGVKNLDCGEADVYLDGKKQATIDTYAPVRCSQQELFKKRGLTRGKHTIKIVVKGTKAAHSRDVYVVVDAFMVTE